MALIGVIASLKTGEYDVLRTAAGVYDANGRYTAGAATTLPIVASVQVVGGRTLRDMPEGQRGDEIRVVYTATELFSRATGHEPDRIVLDGEPWVCIRVARPQGFGNTHTRAYVARTEKP